MFPGQVPHLVVVDVLGLSIDPVGDEVEQRSGEVDGRTVCEVTALVETHAQDGVPRLQHGEVRGHVRLRARVRLDVGVLGAEERLGPFDGETLDLVNDLAALVVAATRVALGILVREDRSDRLHHGDRGEVLRGDELDVGALPGDFPGDEVAEDRVDGFEGAGVNHRVRSCSGGSVTAA